MLLAGLTGMIFLHAGCAPMRSRTDAKAPAISVKELIKTDRSWDGQELPAYPTGRPQITIRRITLPAGARLETHRHPVINAGILLSGQLTVVTGNGTTLHLQAGDPIVELVNTWHYGINQGHVPAEIVVVYAGVADTPITVVKPH
jgi:quercetin dioxygenase-like cupin family protein